MRTRIAAALALVGAIACGSSSSSAPDAAPCIDTNIDPFNCGECGRVCDAPNAVSGCEAGDCTIERCNDGFFDADGEVRTGCELEDCLDGLDCITVCGSTGAAVCEDAELVDCAIPDTELCNGIDDNCDSSCDEGALAGCRIAVQRSYDGDTSHLFTTDQSAAMTAPFSVEIADYFYLYTTQVPGTEEVFLCAKPQANRYLLTNQSDCESNGAVVMSLGYWATEEMCGSTPLHRTFRSVSNDHFYTLSAAERDAAILMFSHVSQGIAGHVWLAP